ncbi:MAG: D-alanine--D-alanine ligase family protein [Candidatus Paceibacterota bacterium]
MSKKRVGVLRGGPSTEYEVSLKTGKSVIDNLLPEKYEVLDILIDKAGVWHHQGVPIKPENLFKKVDVIFNALHGAYGEDGTVQKLLDYFNIPYTGSTALASAVGMNKVLSKKVYKNNKLKTPLHATVSKTDNLKNIAVTLFKTFPMPVVVKPVDGGSSVGTNIAKTIMELESAITDALNYSDTALIEEFIVGKEATCGVVDNFRNQEVYALLPNEIRKPTGSDFYDYNAKYVSEEPVVVCPGNFAEAEKKIIQEMAVNAHKALGLRHYSRSDFIIHPRRGIYILETNTLPGMTSHSHTPQSMMAIGCTLPQFLDHLINLALNK